MVYIGLGSNLDDPVRQIENAVTSLDRLDQCHILTRSGLYGSPPMGPQDQPDYINAVVAMECGLPPHDLLKCLQHLEGQQGRIRSIRWGARTLDLDILLFDRQIIETPTLIVPHPGIAERAFVLHPLFEIAPDLNIPGHGAIADLLARCPDSGITRLN